MTHAHETPAQAKAHAAEDKAAAELEDVEPLPPPTPEPLKVGDIVTLNLEGSPHMTVCNVVSGDVTCRWFGKDDALYEKVFHTSELTFDKEENEAKAKKKEAKDKADVADRKAKAKAAKGGAHSTKDTAAADVLSSEGKSAAHATHAAETTSHSTHPKTPHGK